MQFNFQVKRYIVDATLQQQQHEPIILSTKGKYQIKFIISVIALEWCIIAMSLSSVLGVAQSYCYKSICNRIEEPTKYTTVTKLHIV